MQEAVTLFPHSISHSNNGDRLISIEFLPLFNTFAVLCELGEQASKQVFKFQLVVSAYPYDQSSLGYDGDFGGNFERRNTNVP